MTPLFERLDQEEALVRGELAALREKVAVAEERLAHLTITRETLLSLGAEEHVNQDDGTQWPPEGTCPRVVDTSEPGPGRGRGGGISYGDEGLLAR
ncbi:hypothetical protein, partial [Streptomyces sp. NPDC048142]|uniref:hypothetical protein n=1 Tax=Streptomyces sp. NPDC048142 TaxID=3365501 RepID=UPI00372173C4